MPVETQADLGNSFFHSEDSGEAATWTLAAGGAPFPVTVVPTRDVGNIDGNSPSIKLRTVTVWVRLGELPPGAGKLDSVELGLEGDETERGTSEAGGSETEIVLPESSSDVTGFYDGQGIAVGTATAGIILAYDGPGRTATVDRPWPDADYSSLARYRIFERAVTAYLVAEAPNIDETDRVATVRLRLP